MSAMCTQETALTAWKRKPNPMKWTLIAEKKANLTLSLSLSLSSQAIQVFDLSEIDKQGWHGRFVQVKTEDLIPPEFMSFPEKWNASLVARVPNTVPLLKEWIEGICKQISYFERSWRNLSKGQWEVRLMVCLRPPRLGLWKGTRTYPCPLIPPLRDSPGLPRGKRRRGKENLRALQIPSQLPLMPGDRGGPDKNERTSVLHHESFLRYRVEVNQLELVLKEQARKKDMYKLLSEQQDRTIKDLQAELDRA
uniref:Uncharacterized protein LOC104229288 n=1 Tax=Nicotiana sylvestris TaxID=4096 RepID=A0A1U7WSC3_NICSY|nr:PREDICTED: uncharacterized protein LOC104229288 [Nicotiana sylvestris]